MPNEQLVNAFGPQPLNCSASADGVDPTRLEQVLARHLADLGRASLVLEQEHFYPLGMALCAVVSTCHFPTVLGVPKIWGRVAAVHTLSRIYAMGGNPLLLQPLLSSDSADMEEVLSGCAAICREAGVSVAEQQSRPGYEVPFGLVAVGLAHPAGVKWNGPLVPGDHLVLGKPLGGGIYQAAAGRGLLHPHDLQELQDLRAHLSFPGPALACLNGVHVVTEVGRVGGLAGRLQELCRISSLGIRLNMDAIPRLHRVDELLTGNWPEVECHGALSGASAQVRALLGDQQLCGGLLVACNSETITEVLSIFLQAGFGQASVIGEAEAGEPGLRLY